MKESALILFGIAVAGLFGTGFGNAIANDHWRWELIQRGHAHYDTKTGEWKWNDQLDAVAK